MSSNGLSGVLIDGDDDDRPGMDRNIDSELTFPFVSSSNVDDDVDVDIDPEDELFGICEHAIAVEDEDYDYEKRWDSVREWLILNEEEVDLEEAITKQNFSTYLRDITGYNGWELSAMHLICCHRNPPIDIVKMFIVHSDLSVAQGDANNLLPLSHACMNNVNVEVVKLLLEAYPEGSDHLDSDNKTPLETLLSRSDFQTFAAEDSINHAAVVRLLCFRGAAKIRGSNGMYPIHFACAFGCSASVVAILADAYPPAIHKLRDIQGRTTLHFVMTNPAHPNSPEIIKTLIEKAPEVIDKWDNRNKIPSHLFLRSVAKFDDVADPEAAENIKASLSNYLDGNPRATSFFISTLTKLPHWIKDHAVENKYLQDMLNKKITQRVPTLVLFLDIYIYMFIAILLPRASRRYLEGLDLEVKHYIMMFIGAFYFLVREIMQVASAIAVRSFTNWITDFTNSLDLTIIVLLFYLGSAFSNSGSRCTEEEFLLDPQSCRNSMSVIRGMTVITTSLVFTSILSFAKSSLVEFSVFVNGVLYVVSRLGAFVISLILVLLAFAQVQFFIFIRKDECPENVEEVDGFGFPHCSLSRSILDVWRGITGEVDPDKYQDNRAALFFFIIYVFVVCILLVNVLIAIVVDNYGVIKNERASIVFWANRLDFVAEIDGSINTVLKLFNKRKVMNQATFDDSGSVMWDKLSAKTDNKDTDTLTEFFSQAFVKGVALTIMFLWFLVGFPSMGFFWPPQIREYILAYRGENVSKNDIVLEVSSQVAELKQELHELKVLSKEEKRNDRKEMMQMKEQAESLQKEVMEDMEQIREIMKMLLELRKKEHGLSSSA